MRRRTAATILIAGALLAAPPAASDGAAQQLTLQRGLPARDTGPCPAGGARAAPAAPSAERREQARRLGSSAATSLLAGDAQQAREILRRAVALDPSSTELVYRLARAHEDVGDVTAAVEAYCRLRLLAPGAEADAEERLQALAGRAGAGTQDTVSRHFLAGVRSFDGGDFVGAENAFSQAIAAAPALAPAYYDRAVARLARGRVSGALEDLERYTRLVPGGVDVNTLRARDVLRQGRHDPDAVLAAGVLPGGAQFYTGRPARGALVVLATAVGVYLAMDGQAVFERRTALDPFGNPYEYLDPRPRQTHPRRGIGISVAGAAILGGAIEGFLHAREGRSAVDALRARLRASVARAP